MINNLSLSITLIRDYIPNGTDCYFCFEEISETFMMEIDILTPISHKIPLHAECYEKTFIGMLQLADQLRSSMELN
jgi:hypothetical protein